MRKSVIFLLFAMFWVLQSCKSQQPTGQDTPFSIAGDDKFEVGSKVLMQITFTSDLILLKPMEPRVEQWTENGWETVSTLYCPCNPCPPPPQERKVRAGDAMTFRWDQNEEICQQGQLLKTQVSMGKYRFVYRYIDPDSKTRGEISRSFMIE